MRSRHEQLYHLTLRSDWETAKAGGTSYRTSTLGLDLTDVGFIHCSWADQVATVADRVYRGRDDVLLLTVDPDVLHARVVPEPSGDDGEEFPHVYGPIDLDAVVRVTPVSRGADGSLDVTAALEG